MGKESPDVLDSLIEVLRQRKQNPSEKSYTASLFTKGDVKICAKITEEAGELVEAALQPAENLHHDLVHEAADLIFHTLVLLVHHDLSLDDIRGELQRRFGTSGLEEKASRGQ